MPVVFFDTNALYIQGYRDSFVAGSLTADLTPIGVGVRVLHGVDYLVNDLWSNYTRQDGSTFVSSSDLMAYLAAQFSMRRPLGITFVQSTVASAWTISHSLGFRPNVSVIDTAGDLCLADVAWPDDATVIVSFGAPTSGTAYLS